MEYNELYELSPKEFEQLVAELLPLAGFSDVRLVGAAHDKGVDLIGTEAGRPVAFQVKHKVRLSLREIRQFTDRYFADSTVPRRLIFVTSADLPSDVGSIAASVPPGCEIQFIGRKDIGRLLSSHNVSRSWLETAAHRVKEQRIHLSISVLGVIASLLAVLYPLLLQPKENLDTRIQNVEKAIASMRDLESYLAEVKKDMIAKEEATALINAKYAQAKELDKLTDQQFAAIQTALQKESWRRRIFDYLMGLVLGVAGSLVATILYKRWERRKALR